MNDPEQPSKTDAQIGADNDNPDNQSRRDAMKKLGKYGKVSATVTAVVYTGLHTGKTSAVSPPSPPTI